MSTLLRAPDETPSGDLETPSYRLAGAAQIGRAVQTGYLMSPDEDPLVPTQVQQRLKALSPRLALAFFRPYRVFQLLLRWENGDPRFEIMGEAGRAFPYEILGMFDPRSIGVHEIPTWVEQRLRILSGSREDLRRMVAEDAAAREAQDAAARQAIADKGKQAVVDALTEATSPRADRVAKRRTVVKSI